MENYKVKYEQLINRLKLAGNEYFSKVDDLSQEEIIDTCCDFISTYLHKNNS